MPYTCEHCQEIFYSETEYREHTLFVKQEAVFDKILSQQAEQVSWLSRLDTVLHMWMVLHIAEREGLSYEEATRKFLGEFSDAFNRVLAERRKKA